MTSSAARAFAAAALLVAARSHAVAATPATDTPANDARKVSLHEVLAAAVTGNADLLREQVALDIANANVIGAAGQFDFVLSGDGTFARRRTPSISSTDQVSGFTETLTVDLALSRALESGGQVSLAAQGIRTSTNSRLQCGTPSAAATMDCSLYSSNLSLTFTQPLLRNFGSEVALANLHKQRIQRDVELLNRQARAAVVVRDVVTAYWELGYATDDLAIRNAAVTLAQEQRNATQAMVDVGRLGLADLAAVDRAIADRQIEIATAEQALLGRALDVERLLGRAVKGTFVAYGTAERPAALASVSEPTAEIEHALMTSPQLRALRTGLELSQIDIRTAQSLLHPEIDFVGAIGTAGREQRFADTWAQTARFENLPWSAGLTFTAPIQNRAARGGADAARAAAEKARIDALDLELGIRDGVVRFGAAARAAARRVELARDEVGYAQTNLAAERARFDVGRSTNNDVLLRQQELKTAEIQVARALADLAIAETNLDALTGDILDRHSLLLRGA